MIVLWALQSDDTGVNSMVSSKTHAKACMVLLKIFINHDIAKWFNGKERRPLGQVATHKADAYCTDFVLLSISVSWMILFHKCSLFVLV